MSEFRLRGKNLPAGTTVSIMGSTAKVNFRNSGPDALIDLSKLKPGEVPGELLVLKLGNALR